MSLPFFLGLSERSGLDREVEVGLNKDGGFWMEDNDVEVKADVAENNALLSDLVRASLSEQDFSH